MTVAFRPPLLLALATLAFLAAAGDVRVPVARPPVVAVFVDASPSTRGAWFRDAAVVRAVARRLAPDATLTFETFADGDAEPLAPAGAIGDRAADRTALPRVDADAVMLFSDGRLEISGDAATPVFPIVRDDAAADAATPDARIVGVERAAERLVVRVANDGPQRVLTFPGGATATVPSGTSTLAGPAPRDVGDVRLDAGDRWPENDAARVGPAVALAAERWWVGASPPAGYRAVDPAAPPPPGAWLAARAVVVNDTTADGAAASSDGFSAASGDGSNAAFADAAARYVRDLGGALVIVGRPPDATLDALSPLAGAPPEPRREWVILVDASGSMAARTADGRSRLDRAVDAAAAIARAVPAADAVAFASFARDLLARPARDYRRAVPPAGLAAGGPTNLRAALDALAARPHALPLRAVVLTDGQADLGDATALAARLGAAGVTIDWVALDARDAPGVGPLAALARATGGTVIDAGDAARWPAVAAAGVRAATLAPPLPGPVRVTWEGEMSDLGASSERAVQAAYLRADAVRLATADGRPVAARWNVGRGGVAALAFAATDAIVARVVAAVERPPGDARFAVRWREDRVIVDAAETDAADTAAADAGRTLDGLAVTLRTLGGDGSTRPLDQTAPGRYEAALSPSDREGVDAIAVDGRIVAARSRPALAAEEFRAIGVDRDALDALARRTGGRVIRADDATATLPATRRRASLATALTMAGIAVTAFALARRRTVAS